MGIPTGVATLSLDFEEVHHRMVGLLSVLEQTGGTVGESAAALIMALSKLLAPTQLSPEEEIAFMQALFEWVGMFFAEVKS